MTPDERAVLDDLTARARAGDAAALGSLFGQLRPLLVRIAQREIGRSHARLDAEDVASDVMLRLIDRFRDGEGPADNPVAYLARAIRNRVIDVRRGAASRDVGADDFATLADAYVRIEDADEQRRIDVADDLALVRVAMSRLSERHRSVLMAVAVEGMRPREIAAMTGEAPNTVAAAASRARKALTIELRRAVLEAEGAEECVAHREALATERSAAVAAAEHLRTCGRCQRALARFAALPALALAVPLAMLSGVVGEATAAHAAAASGVAGATATQEPSDASSRPRARGKGATRAVVLAAAGLAVLVALALVLVAVLMPTAPDADSSASQEATASPSAPAASGSAPPSASSSPASPSPSPSGVVVDPDAQANPVALSLDVALGAGQTTIDVGLALDAGASAQRLLVSLPDSMRIVDSGDWTCPTGPGGGWCTPSSPTADAATVVVDAVDGSGRASGDVTIEAVVVADGVTATASTTGMLVVEP